MALCLNPLANAYDCFRGIPRIMFDWHLRLEEEMRLTNLEEDINEV